MELRIVASIQAKPEHVDAVAQAIKKWWHPVVPKRETCNTICTNHWKRRVRSSF